MAWRAALWIDLIGKCVCCKLKLENQSNASECIKLYEMTLTGNDKKVNNKIIVLIKSTEGNKLNIQHKLFTENIQYDPLCNHQDFHK